MFGLFVLVERGKRVAHIRLQLLFRAGTRGCAQKCLLRFDATPSVQLALRPKSLHVFFCVLYSWPEAWWLQYRPARTVMQVFAAARI